MSWEEVTTVGQTADGYLFRDSFHQARGTLGKESQDLLSPPLTVLSFGGAADLWKGDNSTEHNIFLS